MRTFLITMLAALIVAAPALASEATDPKAVRFDALLKKVQSDPSGTKESEARELLELARQLGRSYAASLGIRGYLSHNFRPSPELLLATADAAYRAGDYTFAAARYKAYLAAAKGSKQAARAAATLYTVLVDFLGAEDDAFGFISQHGHKFRSEPSARRFDSWFLGRARARSDCAAAAKMLALAMADRMPVEQERLYYWPALDWLMAAISRGSQRQFSALPDCKRIVPLIRDDRARSKRFAFYVANLSYKAGSAGKDKEALERDFELVAQAAKDYLAASPSAATLGEITEVMAGGIGRFDDATWERNKPLKQAFFVSAFGKLSEAEREKTLASLSAHRAGKFATPAQWARIGAENARLLARAKSAASLPLMTRTETLDEYRKKAAFLKGVASRDAAIINSIAAGGGDMKRAIDHLMARESWHVAMTDYHRLLRDEIFPACERLAKSAKKELPKDARYAAWLHFGEKYLTKTPIAMYDTSSVQYYLRAVWRVSGTDPNDKTQVARHLKLLAWAPFYRDRNRRSARAEMLNSLNQSARQWSDALRRAAKQKRRDGKPAVDPKLLAQIAPLQEALRAARAPADPSKAPNELCKAMAEAMIATYARDDATRIKAERRAYHQVKNYDKAATPCGRDVFQRISSGSARQQKNLDFQIEMLADQLASFRPGDSEEKLDRLMGAVFSRRYEWALRQTHARNKDQCLKINALLARALGRMIDRGKFSAKMFDWYRGTRVGRGWNGGAAGQELMEKVIAGKLFHSSGYRAHESSLSATTSYMRIVRDEFPGLAKKYPPATWFDDMFVEEARKAKFLDWDYWEFGRDEKRKIANAAAKILASQDRLPLGFDGREPFYTLTTLNRWMDVALRADKKARDALLARTEGTYGRTRFDAYAMGYAWFAAADRDQPMDRKAAFARLATYVERASKAPARVSMPSLGMLKDVPADQLTDAELAVLIRMFTDAPSPYWGKGMGFDTAAALIHEALIARGRQGELFPLVGHFWKVSRDGRDYTVIKRITSTADALRKAEQTYLALAYSSVGLTLMQGFLPSEFSSSLGAVRSWALSEMGGIIPVAKGHPLRALYEAQVAYLTGKYQTAWETYLAHRQRLRQSYKEFDPAFCIWVIEKNTEFRNFDTAEALAREMLTWFDDQSERFEAEVRAGLQLSYADIALARDDRPRARALYERIAATKEFAGTRSQLDAELRIADVDTKDGSYDRAIERLENLARRKDRYLQTEAFYHLGKVKYAQEEYTEAKEQLEQAFSLSPDHANGRILEGRINLKLKKLEQPTDIDLGEKIGKKFIVPGRPVRVTLVDRNLSIVRKASEIEIRAWTDSGDEELFSLTPFGDSKTKFKGQIDTALGAVKKRDHVLQVIGKDRVHYAFSEQFAKAQKIASNEPFTLSVATDAELYASSGKILSRQEREAKALEEMIRKRMGEQVEQDDAVPLSTVRADNQIKPGNKINVRVVDPDRGETRSADRITVRLATTSGDSIGAFTLTETDTHSGVFEGAVPTEPAQATAYASDSQEGTEANFAISSKKYPPWVGLPKPSMSRPKTFSVDLNDNVALGRMRIVAAEPSRKLKSFLVQTSFNARDFTTVGAWPEKFTPWGGQATVEWVRYRTEQPATGRRARVNAPATLEEYRDYFEQGHIRFGEKKASAGISRLAAAWTWELAGKGRTLGLDSNKANKRYYLAHMSAAFYQPRRQIRSFVLMPKGDGPHRDRPVSYLIALDGQAATSRKPREDGGIEVKRAVGKGVHRVDVYVFSHQNGDPEFEVLCDTDKPPYLVPCPAEMFDVAKHPEISEGLAREVATVTASKSDTTFDVAFPAESRGRVIRLLLTDFESDAPAINKIELTDAEGKGVLPTKHDFMQLRKNGVLEIVPGDRVTVTYEDPKVLTRGKDQHEAFLTATYTNAELSACFVDYTVDTDGQREAHYTGMRRFKAGDKINVFINDPDCDTTEKLDTIQFTARTTDGKPVTLTALETEEHSGVFLGTLFPIEGAPKRRSELTVKSGDDVVLGYLDRENTDPGIPWARNFAVEQVWYDAPQVRLYDVTSLTLEEADKLAGRPGSAARPRGGRGGGAAAKPGTSVLKADIDEIVPIRRTLLVARPGSAEPAQPTHVVIGGPLLVEVLFPFITKSPDSECSIYVQTSSGRAKAGKPAPAGQFDANVPGTLKLTVTPSDFGSIGPPPGYREVVVRDNPYAMTPLDDGRFAFSVPMKLGPVPDGTLVGKEEEAAIDPGVDEIEPLALSVNGSDEIFVGLNYKDEAGKEHWTIRTAELTGDAFFDVMGRRYQERLEGVFVGENLYFRVIDPTRDTTDKKDVIRLELATKSGKTRKLDLVETYTHSGIFKGLVKMVHEQEKSAAAEPGNMAAVYGDLLSARYTQPRSGATEAHEVTIFKGSDGAVVPFTKRFKDPAIAVRTQFMVAEAYFELAKRHRQLKRNDLARDEIAKGRKLLEEAIRDYPDTQARAQAEYLLADLSLEFGNDAATQEQKKKHYNDAIARYSDIVATYGDSEYAPKAQYRKALAYEKMEMLDQACEEYVKLSYRYPENPLVAETIARLGQYFLGKGEAIRERAEKETDVVKQEKIRLEAAEMFKTAGQVFSRLAVRFPNHRLAGKTMLLSAQCFMQAEDFDAAVKGYTKVIKTPDMDKDLVAEGMYWCGHSYMETDDLVEAYRMFKKLTWDYPATKWAKFARGRLADEKLANIEADE